ncbi:PREDICTED: uncharacterized protein LOC105129717 [Populus euphratica]|uniref:Uncharacterized protein LOC105129717 n=1 Tax=Populus euphratica TaxID=75702 RepID=A0AAJ6UJ53_POPEU|nr:PREDICTED: uncharacterized protein LOC105129717 [Populus euphratica]
MVSKIQKLARKRFKGEHPDLYPKPEPTLLKDPNKKKKKKKSLLKRKNSDPKEPYKKGFRRHPLRVPGMKPGDSCFICKAKDHIAKLFPKKSEWERNKICLLCRHRGHSLKHCPNKNDETMDQKLCYSCGEKGHSLSQCPQPREDGGTNLPIALFVMNVDIANAASGMAVDDECKLKFLELKAKRNYRFIIFKIESQQVVVEKLGSPEETYEEFAASLPADECRYAVFDYDFTTNENCQKSKIFFIAWSPDTSRIRSKMVYASSKDRFKRELDGIQVELQATDPSEMSFDIIKSRAL